METPSSGHDAQEVQKAIEEFFTIHLLFWVEVLSLTGNLDASVYAINNIQQWYNSVSCDQFVHQILYSHVV
jgi:hypothetical protein